MNDDRRLMVLRAIVEDYVASREPVGSKTLVEGHDLGVSSATIRNDMAALEDEGYIVQPHTSAGRIPTDKGYRLFVDRLATIQPMTTAEKRAIQTFLDSAVDLDNVVERTVRLLAQLTRQVAVVQYPSLGRSHVRHVELVPVGRSRILVVLIADTGRVEQRTVDAPAEVTDPVLADLSARLNTLLHDKSFSQVQDVVDGLSDTFSAHERPLVAVVLATLIEAAVEEVEERVVIGGAANLARYGQDFPNTINPVLEALEEHVVLLRLLGEVTTPDQVAVRIGHENAVVGLDATSVVTTGYGPHNQTVAHLGVVGPTRMDYPGAITSVRAVARYLGRMLGER